MSGKNVPSSTSFQSNDLGCARAGSSCVKDGEPDGGGEGCARGGRVVQRENEGANGSVSHLYIGKMTRTQSPHPMQHTTKMESPSPLASDAFLSSLFWSKFCSSPTPKMPSAMRDTTKGDQAETVPGPKRKF